MKNKTSVLFALFAILVCTIINAQESSRKFPSTEEAKRESLEKLRQTAAIITKVIRDKECLNTISEAITAEYYEDESILFKDLLQEGEKSLISERSGKFKAEFEYAATELNIENLRELEEYLINDNIQIYFPYSASFKDLSKVTVSFHPIENDEKNDGVVVSEKGTNETVLVTDEYALKNPTLIVSFYEGSRISKEGEYIPPVKRDMLQQINKPFTWCNVPSQKVYVGKMKFFNQWDNIFNGGPEFYFFRGQPTPLANGNQVSGFNLGFTVNCKRGDKGFWKDVSTLWDSEWEEQSQKQHLGVYEDDADSNSSTTFSGGVAWAASPAAPNINGSYTYNVNSDDNMVYYIDYGRCSFFSSNQTPSPVLGSLGGWRLHGNGAELIWTMPTENN